MKSAIFVVLLGVVGACGTSGGPQSSFDPEACGSGWMTLLGYTPTSCDRQCAPMPAAQSGSGASSGSGALCYASRPDSANVTCTHTFTDGYGLTGCCFVEDTSTIVNNHPVTREDVHFYECP